jgi:Fe2+ transport system protein FeoA
VQQPYFRTVGFHQGDQGVRRRLAEFGIFYCNRIFMVKSESLNNALYWR